MLEEMDEEFGVGELVEETIKEERNKVGMHHCVHVHVHVHAYTHVCVCFSYIFKST